MKRIRAWLKAWWLRIRGYKPIYGCDWGYSDDRSCTVIGYRAPDGTITICDVKTWREILP